MFSRINELILQNSKLKDDNIELDENTDLIYDLGYNSLTFNQLIIDIEKEFCIEIDDMISELSKHGKFLSFIINIYYSKFYSEYMGINENKKDKHYEVYLSEYRENPINKKYLYCVIITKYNNKYIISSSKYYKNEIISKIDMNALISLDYYKDNLIFNNLKVRKMYRFILDKIYRKKVNNDFDNEYELSYNKDLNKYIAKVEGEIVSYCKISDIIMRFGNIVVYTKPEFRNKGIAAYLLHLIIYKCYEKNIIPMYVVDSDNKPSIKLALKTGFVLKSEEIIISKNITNKA